MIHDFMDPDRTKQIDPTESRSTTQEKRALWLNLNFF